MKKIILGMSAAALMMGSVSCAKTTGVTEEEKLTGDSISIAVGHVMGARIKQAIQRQAENETTQWNIDKLMRGIESVLYADTADNYSYYVGQQVGMEMMNPLRMLAQDGLPYDAHMVLKAFKEVVTADTVTGNYMDEYQRHNATAHAIKERKENERLAVEGAANAEAGKAFVDSVKKADNTVMTSESGLSYKIENAGDETKVAKTDKVLLNYKGSTINGTVFDETKGQPREMNVSSLIPGFTEGLQMLGKGGKAVVYIPGELGYGERGIPSAGIGPNSTLVFEIEVVDIVPVEAPADNK